MTKKSRILRWSSTPALFLGLSIIASALDSDSDGLDDSVETNTGTYVSSTNTGTNPNNPDTDTDGVPDGLEIREKTSPLDASKFNPFSKGMTAFYPFNGSLADKSGNQRGGSAQGNYEILPNGLRLIGDQALYYVNGGWFKPDSGGMTNNSFSLSVWIKNLSSGGIHPETHVLNVGTFHIPEMGNLSFSYGTQANSFVSYAYYPDGNNFYESHSISSQVNHLTITKENLRVRFFINGTIVRDLVLPQNYQFLPNDYMSLNRHWWGGGSSSASRSTGTYSNCRLYSRALAPTEVLALYQSEMPRFQLIQGSYTWHEAKADAETRGGRMAVLNTAEKIAAAKQILSSSGSLSDYWIGLSDIDNEGVWKWITGELLTSHDWNLATGEPNDGLGNGTEDGAQTRSVWGWSWNDAPLTTISGYILEFPGPALTTTPTNNGTIQIDYPFDASTATLTAIPNPGYLFTGWTGDATGTDNPLELVMDSDKIIGATFAPDLSDTDGDGLTAYDEAVIYGTDPTKSDTDADGLTDDFEVTRYTVISSILTWSAAKADAASKGGGLATFANQAEWNQALQLIGESSLVDVNGLWIGATDQNTEGAWTWITGEPFGFANWAAGQPDNLNDSDYAAVAGDLGGEVGKWYDYRATTTRDGYILESGYSTNPLNPDTDGDGLNDGAEYAAGSNPFVTDTDGDGLSDSQEVNLTETNPILSDSDGDGTNDADDDQDGDGLGNLAEITTHLTNPTLADSDGDGLSDGAEITTHLTNPNVADSDADGLSDGQEVDITSDPLQADTDADGLSDGAEFNTYHTSPLLTDSDDDGLDDRAEVEVHLSNPTLKDSDGDGFEDGYEVNNGFSPASATSTPEAQTSIRTAVEFRFNAASGVSYRIEDSTDLQNWNTVETDIIGSGGMVTRFYSTENQPKRYFRVRRN